MIRKEIYSRSNFAYSQGVFWYKKIGNSLSSGNIMTCKAALKYQQARRIFIHYSNEFQNNQNLPLSI